MIGRSLQLGSIRHNQYVINTNKSYNPDPLDLQVHTINQSNRGDGHSNSEESMTNPVLDVSNQIHYNGDSSIVDVSESHNNSLIFCDNHL